MTITLPGMLYLERCAKQNSKDVRQYSHPLMIQSSTKWGTAVKGLCCAIKVTNQLILQTLSQIILITQGIQFNIRNNILIIRALQPWMDLTASKSSQKCYKILTIPWGKKGLNDRYIPSPKFCESIHLVRELHRLRQCWHYQRTG